MTSAKLLFGGMLSLAVASQMGIFSGAIPSNLDNGQKGGLEEFRALVEKLDVPNGYMKDDAYLLRLLTAKNFNLKDAFDNLQESLTIRKAEKIDSILEEDWSEFEKRFPYSTSSVNKEGRPILYYPFGKWDINNEITTGDFQKFARFAGSKMLEEMDRKVHSMRKENNAVTQFDMIIDFDGYTLEKHGCLHCIETYRAVMKQAETLYSGANKKTYFINTPLVFKAVYPWLASVFVDEGSQKAISVLGEKESFKPALLQDIDLEQFPQGVLKQLE